METTGIAAKVLQGSRNIDQMRKDTRDLVRMLEGIVRSVSGNNGQYSYTFYGNGFHWDVSSIYPPGNPLNSNVSISFSLEMSSTRSESLSCDCARSIPASYAQRVYRELDTLIWGLLREFPALEERLEPFIKASEVQI